jgi:hypothetical protein
MIHHKTHHNTFGSLIQNISFKEMDARQNPALLVKTRATAKSYGLAFASPWLT